MEVDFLEPMHYNLLKLLGHFIIIHMHLPLKQLGKQMHGFQNMIKLVFCSIYFCFLL